MPWTLDTLPAELQRLILEYIPKSDLAHCARVSRSWNTIMAPYLWQTIGLEDQTVLDRCFCTPSAHQVLLRHAAFVKHLRLTDTALHQHLVLFPRQNHSSKYNIFAPLFNRVRAPNFCNLESIELERSGSEGSFEQALVTLVRQNPGLRRFTCPGNLDHKTIVNLVIRDMPNLQHLNIACHSFHYASALLENLPESIRMVGLQGIEVLDGPEASKSIPGIVPGVAKRHHALETCLVGGTFGSRIFEILGPFLRSCGPKLRILEAYGADQGVLFTNPKITAVLQEIGFTWKSLYRFHLPRDISDAYLAEILSRSPHWTKIALGASEVGRLTTAAILDRCGHLKRFSIMDGGDTYLDGSHLQIILTKATQLISLQASSIVVNPLTATQILSSKWATTSLRSLALIIDVPRVSETAASENSSSSSSIQSSRDIQRQVLRRLGEQTNLIELEFGGSLAPRDTVFQHNCLELTLESGLDELVGLKRLEMLNVSFMDHDIGVPELEWMAKHFPRLERVYGVAQDCRPLSPQVDQWLKTHRPAWK